MLKIIIKTILIIFNLLFMIASAKDFNKENHSSFAYICTMFIELIAIVVML